MYNSGRYKNPFKFIVDIKNNRILRKQDSGYYKECICKIKWATVDT